MVLLLVFMQLTRDLFAIVVVTFIAVNVKWMERGFIAGKTLSSIPIYVQPFTSLRYLARYWSEIATFPYPLHLMPPLWCFHWNCGKYLVLRKLESQGYQSVKILFEDKLIRFDTIPVCDGQTDGQIDGQPIAITCAV